LKKAATDQKYVEMDQKEWGNRPEKKRKPFNYKYWETDTKYSEIPQQFWAFEGILWNSSKVNLIRFRVARFPCYQQFLYLKSISDFQPTVLLISFSFSDRSGLVHLMLRFHSSPSLHRTWTSQSICHKCWWENSGEPRECS